MEGSSPPSATLFRRPQRGADGHTSGAGNQGVNSSCRSSCREALVKVIVFVLSLVEWIGRKPQLWFYVLAILVASCLPLPYEWASFPAALTIVSVSFVLTGASLPALSKEAAAGATRALLSVMLCVFVAAPLVFGGIGHVVLPNVLRCHNDASMCAGYTAIGLLPPSHVSAVVVAQTALGNGALAKYVTSAAALVSMWVSPHALRLLLRDNSTLEPDVGDISRVTLLATVACASFAVGVIAQRCVLCWTTKRRSSVVEAAPDAPDGGQGATRRSANEVAVPVRLSFPSPSTPSESVSEPLGRWREWALRLNGDVAIVAVYVLFSFVLQHPASSVSPADSSISSSAAAGVSDSQRGASQSSSVFAGQRGVGEAAELVVTTAASAILPEVIQKPFLSGPAMFAFIVLEALGSVCVAVLAWFLSGRAVDNAEDRIALVCAGSLRSDITALAVIFAVLPKKEVAHAALAPIAVFVVVQAVGAAVLTTLLRRWRSSVNCRPGTMLLPQRLSSSHTNRPPASVTSSHRDEAAKLIA